MSCDRYDHRRWTFAVAIAALTALAPVGCGSGGGGTETPANDTSETPEDDADSQSFPDSGADATSDTDGPDPKPTNFQLENTTDRTVYVRPPAECEQNSSDWIQLGRSTRGGSFRRQSVQTSCHDCLCRAIEDGSCRICGMPCALNDLEPLEAGASVQWEWPGYIYSEEVVEERDCLRRKTPVAGEEFAAKFCWVTPTDNGDAPDDVESHLECRRKEFSYGESDTIAATIPSP